MQIDWILIRLASVTWLWRVFLRLFVRILAVESIWYQRVFVFGFFDETNLNNNRFDVFIHCTLSTSDMSYFKGNKPNTNSLNSAFSIIFVYLYVHGSIIMIIIVHSNTFHRTIRTDNFDCLCLRRYFAMNDWEWKCDIFFVKIEGNKTNGLKCNVFKSFYWMKQYTSLHKITFQLKHDYRIP